MYGSQQGLGPHPLHHREAAHEIFSYWEGCWAFVLTKVVPAGQPLCLSRFRAVGMVKLEAPFEEPNPEILVRECSFSSLWPETGHCSGSGPVTCHPRAGKRLLWQWCPSAWLLGVWPQFELFIQTYKAGPY